MTEPKIKWNKGYKPESKNLQDILDMMDADGIGPGSQQTPKPLRIVPLVHTKTTIEIDVTKHEE